MPVTIGFHVLPFGTARLPYRTTKLGASLTFSLRRCVKLRCRCDPTPDAHTLLIDGRHELPLRKEAMWTCLLDVCFMYLLCFLLLIAGSRSGWPGGSVHHRREVTRQDSCWRRLPGDTSHSCTYFTSKPYLVLYSTAHLSCMAVEGIRERCG